MVIKNSRTLLFPILCLAMVAFGACNQTKTTEQESTTRAEEDLKELRAWIEEKTENLDSAKDQKWPEVKEEFKTRSAKLDTRLDSLSAESKEEYKELRRKYENWEARNQQRANLPLYPETLDRFEQELLGSATALDSAWTTQQVVPYYSLFVKNVQAKRSSWTASDWDYADEIYAQMNKKKDPLEESLSTKDKLRIKALQSEFLALETTRDAKDLYKGIR